LYCCQRALSTDKGHLYKSTDGGENWLRIDSTLYTLDPMVSVSSILLDDDKPGRIYIGLLDHGQPLTTTYSNGGLYLTENDGKSWRKVYGGEVSIIKADYSSPRNIYFATKFGLMKLLDTLTVTSVGNFNNTIPDHYYLEQNYPNPFNPVTTIKYRIPEEGTVTLKIYDLLGREVKTLVNEQKAAGRYEVEFDADDLASGVYIYRLQVNDYASSKKMILMK